MYYSPVRHSPPGASTRAAVRLACVRHAASVQSEPGSNSSVQTCYCFRFSYEPVAHSKSLTKDLIAQTFLNYFLCETRLLSLLRRSRRTTARPPSSTHTYRLLVFKEHSLKSCCFLLLSCVSVVWRGRIMRKAKGCVKHLFRDTMKNF